MNTSVQHVLDTEFSSDVLKGLSQFPKKLSSKYIYDKKGDALFQQIMDLPEYYLTNCEYDILSTHTNTIAKLFDENQTGFDLIELGAGDGRKTIVLLEHLSVNQYNFTYKPIDISENAIESISSMLSKELPEVVVIPEKGEYFEVLDRLKSFNTRKKVIMILGSNIGNLLHPRAIDFLSKLKDTMNYEDLLFVGFDQKKNPQVILDAYNDATKVTETFNKNLLARINRELGANFNLEKFTHWETYNPETGTAKSYLVATEFQTVTIEALDKVFYFEKWETIHTEISQKYDDHIIKWLANEAGLVIETSFTDSKQYYKNYAFKKTRTS